MLKNAFLEVTYLITKTWAIAGYAHLKMMGATKCEQGIYVSLYLHREYSTSEKLAPKIHLYIIYYSQEHIC